MRLLYKNFTAFVFNSASNGGKIVIRPLGITALFPQNEQINLLILTLHSQFHDIIYIQNAFLYKYTHMHPIFVNKSRSLHKKLKIEMYICIHALFLFSFHYLSLSFPISPFSLIRYSCGIRDNNKLCTADNAFKCPWMSQLNVDCLVLVLQPRLIVSTFFSLPFVAFTNSLHKAIDMFFPR